jgi:hypothetical protein
MPVPISPINLTCRSCGWRHVYSQHSDVVVLPSACLACGSEDVERTRAGLLEGAAALAELTELISRRLKGGSGGKL